MRIGVIGTGSIAARHLLALGSLPEARVVAHLATSPEKAEAAAARHGGAGFADLDAFVRRGRPDAVIVTVPPARHGAIEERLIADGIPFLVEKPLSADPDLAERIAERLHGHGLVVAVGYHWRALDHLKEARTALAGRAIRMVLGEFHVGTPAAAWWRRRADSGGQFVEQACHLVDLARVLAGEATVAAALGQHFDRPAFADADIAGAGAALLHYDTGAVGVFTATSILPKAASIGLRLVCEGMQVAIALSGATIEDAGGARVVPVGENPYAIQDRTFLDAVAAGDASAVFCTYGDALLTHRTCHRIADMCE